MISQQCKNKSKGAIIKDLVEILRENNIICKKLKEIKFNTKKKIKAYIGVNLKNEYCFILVVDRKSKLLSKDIKSLLGFVPTKINFRYRKKILITEALICKKAKEMLKSWRVL